ncbi:WxL protein host-binding domain-containing protein [Agrilactobacillus yilanensis]|uniref:WxL protein host-binding domain-containing protein n=1 Tax=Agrilactobacillus yilanensis TaxID=2485997 RepID=A0ABW4J5F1_9LACO|nr:DUF3324 domain-containing protein [Agrilactobacillus yilanensis]
MKKWLISLGIGLLAFFCFALPQTVHAANSADFTAEAIPAAGQTDPKLDYFSLSVASNQIYPLTATVENLSSTETLDFSAQLITATTSSHGAINYTPTKLKRDPSAKVVLPELAVDGVNQQNFTIGPKQKQTITFNLKIPADGITGTVLGSIYIHRLDSPNQKKSSLTIDNQFAMVLPVAITQGPPVEIIPNLTLAGVTQTNIAGHAALIADIHNASPVLFGQIQLNAKILQDNKTVLTQTDHNFQMAPNSTLGYNLLMPDKPLPKGRYLLKIRLTSGQKTFNLSKNFQITTTNPQQIKHPLLRHTQNKPTFLIWLILSLILLILLIALLWFLLKRQHHKH